MDRLYKKEMERSLHLERKLSYATREKISLERRLRSAENYSQNLQRQLLVARNHIQITRSSRLVASLRQHFDFPSEIMFNRPSHRCVRSQLDDSKDSSLTLSSNDNTSSSSPSSPEPPSNENVKSMNRLQTILDRNKHLPPHLRSSYAMEGLPSLDQRSFDDMVRMERHH